MRIFRCLILPAFSAVIALPAAAQVVPDYYAEPGLDPRREQLMQNRIEHVDPFSGSLHLSYLDIVVPGNGGLDLKIYRNYTSVQYDREFTAWRRTVTGLGWTMHFGRALNSNANVCTNFSPNLSDNPVIELPDGRRQILYTPSVAPGGDPNRIWISADRWVAKCVQTPGAGLIVTSPEGVQYTMNSYEGLYALSNVHAWYTTEIRDRNNNTLTISYIDDPQGYKLISSVVASDGRQVVFQYTGQGTPSVRLASITSDTSNPGDQTWTYNYTAIPELGGSWYQLTSVQRPDALSWVYAYNGNLSGQPGSYELHQVTYPYLGTTTYSYGFAFFDSCPTSMWNTVVTQKDTAGDFITPGTWTFAYSPDWNNAVTGDQTTVTTPVNRIVYTHFGLTTAAPGSMWQIGLPLKKETFELAGALLETEEFTWGSQIISADDYARPTRAPCINYTDTDSMSPILTQRKVTRDGTAYTTAYSNHDTHGNPQTVTETGNASRTTTLTYYINLTKWIVKQLKNETISTFGTIARTFDTNGNLTSEDRYGVNTTFLPFATGDLQKATNARGFFTDYASYKRGIAQTETQPEGRILGRVVDNAGNITSETDGEGHATSYTYDGLNRVTGITYPVNAPATISFQQSFFTQYCGGLFSKQLTRSDFVETTCFDGFGKPVKLQQKNSAGSITVSRTFTYDAAGRKTFESYPNSATGTAYTYDALNRLLTVTHPGNVKKTLVYQVGNKVRVTNERSKITTYTYRSYGNPDDRALMLIDTSVVNADVTLTRNLIGQILTIAQDGKTTTYGYNANKFLATVTQPEIALTTFGRDAVGNMSTRQVGASGVTAYTYDGLNRLTFTDHPNTTPDVRRVYDRNNRLTQVTTLDGAGGTVTDRTYGYDFNGNLQTETLALDAGAFNVAYSYNAKDHLANITYPSTLVVDYAPDPLGRPTKATPSATTVAHHASGQVSSIILASAARTDLTFNARYWPATLVHKDAAAANLVSSTYVYDGVGNITSITDTASNIYNRTLAYDDIDRVTTTSSSSVWGTGSVTYNGRGDILTQSQGTGFSLTYTYNPTSGLLASVTGSAPVNYPAFTYDVYGNVTGNGVFTFVYDDAPNMTCSNCGSANRIDYTYDGKNMRVKSVKSGATTYSFYAANGNLLFEYDLATATYADYVYLKDKLLSKRTPSATIYMHDDLLGSPMAATDAAGVLAWRENYRPYGSQLLGQGTAANSLWFTGKSHDQDTKLSYMGARYYDTQLGRFMGIDPALFDEKNVHSVNRYAYANNNPGKFTDPEGELPIFAIPFLPLLGNAIGVAGVGLTAFEVTTAIRDVALGNMSIGEAIRQEGPGLAVGMIIPGGKGAVKATTAIASSAKQAADLSRHLGYVEKYGRGGVKELESGRIRYYGEVTPASKAGEMAGQRYVHEFDPVTGSSRGWFETIDQSGKVRQVRPELKDGVKRHYQFDRSGDFSGSR